MRCGTHAYVVGFTAFLVAGGISRADLIVNGGFESGNFDPGWHTFGNTGVSFSPSVNVAASRNGVGPHSGNFMAFFGPTSDTGGSGGIYQQLTVPANTTLHVSFWLADNGGTPVNTSFSATLGGINLLAPLINSAAFGYTEFTATVTTTVANPTLVFTFLHDAAYFDLDDVSVTVPLPSGAILSAGGLAGIAGFSMVRRKRFARG
jgi:hypothetical protein